MLSLIRARQRAADGERGATLVVVMIVMFVLMTVAVVVGALVLNTMTSVVSSRSTAQSRAAADAGLAVAVSKATTSGGYCPATASYVPKAAVSAGSTATYQVETICGSDQVTFRSTGEAGSGKTVTDAVYKYIVTATPGTGADMIFFANTKFTEEVVSHAGVDGSLLSLVIPGGGFVCQADIPGNIIAAGDFSTSGGCNMQGDVRVNGVYTSAQSDTHIHGSVTTAKTGATNRADGQIDKNVWVGGDFKLGPGGVGGVGGNIVAGGTVTKSSTSTVGGTTTQNSASKPPALDFAALGFSWFDYAYSNADWGFNETKLAASGSGAGTCSYFNNSPGTGWTSLTTRSNAGPIAIDARACSLLSSNMGANPTITLSHDLVLAAKTFDLTTLTINAAPGTTPKVWIIVDDAKTPGSTFCTTGCVKNQKPDVPTGGGSAGDIKINGTVIGDGVTAMAYTPGKINVAGISDGVHDDTWRGAFYGGSFDYGGGLNFWGAPIALPGQVAGETPESSSDPSKSVLGERISQVDVK
jgi:Tfp pilus assembly protein PilX